MYKVLFGSTVVNDTAFKKAKKIVVYKKHVHLPFAPFLGLSIKFTDYWGGLVNEVMWCTVQNSFTCNFEPVLTDISKHGLKFDELTNHLKLDGWDVSQHDC